jgi:small subunit ribosomal protein S1
VKIGQVLPFKILKLDPAQKKIGLSARAVGKDSDPEDVRTYHETGGGMATLGEMFKNLQTGTSDSKESDE